MLRPHYARAPRRRRARRPTAKNRRTPDRDAGPGSALHPELDAGAEDPPVPGDDTPPPHSSFSHVDPSAQQEPPQHTSVLSQPWAVVVPQQMKPGLTQ